MQSKKQVFNVPNFLTMFRILIIPVIFALLLFKKEIYGIYASVFFILAVLTDFMDGYIARKKKLITNLGIFLDPIADKLLVVTILIMLIPLNRIPAWVVVIIIFREIFITGLRAIAGEKGVVIPAGKEGKWKTAFQMLGIFFLLIYYKRFYINFEDIGLALIFISIIFSLVSSYKYLKSVSGILLDG
ncbi:MAG: CDP-diacylglycerol--glycerol-3-phosphate 3-phosphatidyltransferase [Deltaproteobacteria bacterium]|nr:CDP-diacylglycerol--glycerol-3-phosphate 3-phosphatidyltransferase [Deltaproteobacteria bacterium]